MAVANNAAVNLDVQAYIRCMLIYVALEIRQGWNRSNIALLLVFERTSVLVSIVTKCSPTYGAYWVLSPLYPQQHLFFLTFLTVLLTEERRDFHVVLICISLVPEHGEHLSCVYWSLVFLLRKVCLLHYSLIGLFVLLVFNFMSSLYIVVISPLLNVHLVKIFFYSGGHLFP